MTRYPSQFEQQRRKAERKRYLRFFDVATSVGVLAAIVLAGCAMLAGFWIVALVFIDWAYPMTEALLGYR